MTNQLLEKPAYNFVPLPPVPSDSIDSPFTRSHEPLRQSQDFVYWEQELARGTHWNGAIVDHGKTAAINTAIDILRASRGDDLDQFTKPGSGMLWYDQTFRDEAARHVSKLTTQIAVVEGRDLTKHEWALTTRTIEAFGLQPGEALDITEAWKTQWSYYNGDEVDARLAGRLAKNQRLAFETMTNLERMQPGAVRVLHRRFGIRHFGRYHPNDLLQQLHYTGKLDGVVVSAVADKGGPFKEQEVLPRYGSHHKRRIVYTEASTPKEAGRILTGIAIQHGKIKSLLVRAHGDEDRVRLGVGDAGLVTKETIRDFIPAGVMDRVSEILLSSCWTGLGFAKDLANAVGSRILAPEGKTRGLKNTKEFIQKEGSVTRRYGPSKIRQYIGSASLSSLIGW